MERNTGSVGLASVPCTSIQAVNPEIAALQQHQDPASDGAAALNKQIASELAVQIDSIGGDATQANEASTFAPGQIGDPTAKGNTCDDANDKAGCINSQNLRVDDLSAAEIQSAVAAGSQGISGGNATAAAGNATAAAGAASAGSAASNDTAAAGAADAAGAASGAGAAEFGACDPTIKFGIPSDGRQEDAFEATDLATFAHGSALNIAVISGFICSQLSSKCDVDAQAVSDCQAAQDASSSLKGQAAADAFNSALGF